MFSEFIEAWTFVIGLAVGSFLNAVIYRLPRGYLLTLPTRSICTKCRRLIRWYENIPVFGFVFLRGKCAGCHSRISPRYLIVELLTGLLFLSIFKLWGLSATTIYFWVFASALLAITFIDIDFQIIPDVISLPGIVVGFIGSIFVADQNPDFGPFSSVLGALAGGGSFWILGAAYEKATGREGLGFGDVKLLGMIGAFLGPLAVLTTVIVSSMVGSIFGITILLIQKKSLRTAMPYGPFLALGALTALFWGDLIAFQFYPQFR